MHRRGALQLFNLSQGQCESQVEGRTYGIPTENDNEYYQVPKNAYEGLEKVQFGDPKIRKQSQWQSQLQ